MPDCLACRGESLDELPGVVLYTGDVCTEHAEQLRHRIVGRSLAHILPPDVRPSKPTDVDPKLADWNVSTGEGVYLYGPPGRGKTWQASILLKRAVVDLWRTKGSIPDALWFPVTSGIDRIKDGFRDDTGAKLRATDLHTAELLVLDDIGMEQATEWARSLLYTVINERMTNRRPTLYTSNLDVAELAAHLKSPPVASRIAGTCRQVHLTGPDRRLR